MTSLALCLLLLINFSICGSHKVVITVNVIVEDPIGNRYSRTALLEPGSTSLVHVKKIDLNGDLSTNTSLTPQNNRRLRIQKTGDTGILTDQTYVVYFDDDVKSFDLTVYYCNGVELVEPVGLGESIVQLIICDTRILAVKYESGRYELESIFEPQYTSSTPVVLIDDSIPVHVSTAMYVCNTEEGDMLFHKSLSGNGFELPLNLNEPDTFEASYGSCIKWETFSYSDDQIMISCPSTNRRFLVGFTKEKNREVFVNPGSPVILYNRDVCTIIASSYVTIYTNAFDNIQAISTPVPITRVDYVHIEGHLIVLLFSSMYIYKFNTSIDVHLNVLVTDNILCLAGECQSYLIDDNYLVYTSSYNGFNATKVVNIKTSKSGGVAVSHPYSPILFNVKVVHENTTLTSPTINSANTFTSIVSENFASIAIDETTIPTTNKSNTSTTLGIGGISAIIIAFVIFILIVGILVLLITVKKTNKKLTISSSLCQMLRRSSPHSSPTSSIAEMIFKTDEDFLYPPGFPDHKLSCDASSLVNEPELKKGDPTTVLSTTGTIHSDSIAMYILPVQEQNGNH